MIPRPPVTTLTYTLIPYTTLFRSRLAGKLAGHRLVGFARLPVEVEDEFKARRQTPLPITGHPWPLVPDVPGKTPPALAAHPVEPCVPIRDELVVAVDQAEVDQHLAIGGHGHLREHAAHQEIGRAHV